MGYIDWTGSNEPIGWKDFSASFKASLGSTNAKVSHHYEPPHYLAQWELISEDEVMKDGKTIVIRAQCTHCAQTYAVKNFVSHEVLHTDPYAVETTLCFMIDKLVKTHVAWELWEKSAAEGYKAIVPESTGSALIFTKKPLYYHEYEWGNPKYSVDPLWAGKSNPASNKLSDDSKRLPGVNYVLDTDCMVEGCDYYLDNVRRAIIHLNDKHKWTREAIADWLEEIHDPTGENGPNINF